jgi:transcription initiation protein SPT3
MMYTFGDVRQTCPASAKLMEELVRHHLIKLLIQASQVCQRRNSRFMNVEDMLFVIRHDTVNVKRVLEFLSWKDVRKEAKNAGGKDHKDGFDLESLETNELEEASDEALAKEDLSKRRRLRLSFDIYSSYYEYVDNDLIWDSKNEVSSTSLRLREADELTKKMNVKEYIDYSECRQASFTFKKNKKFRDWLDIQKYIDIKPNDDVLEILGYIAWETVAKITKAGLITKREMEAIDVGQKEQKREERGKQRLEEEQVIKLDSRKNPKIQKMPFNKVPSCWEEVKLPDNIDEIIKWLSTHRDLERVRDVKGNKVPIPAYTTTITTTATMFEQQGSSDEGEELQMTPIMPIHIYEACLRLQPTCVPLKVFEGGTIHVHTNLVSILRWGLIFRRIDSSWDSSKFS